MTRWLHEFLAVTDKIQRNQDHRSEVVDDTHSNGSPNADQEFTKTGDLSTDKADTSLDKSQNLMKTAYSSTDTTAKSPQGFRSGLLTESRTLPVRNDAASPRLLSEAADADSTPEYPAAEQRHSLQRLLDMGAGYIQITSKAEDIYIALTESAFHELNRRPGLTVYQAAHLIRLSDGEIRLVHALRTIGGPGGSVELKRIDKRPPEEAENK